MLISKAMLAVRHAASTDETRYNLNGIHFRSDTEVEATDGHMLIRASVEAQKSEEFPSVGGLDRTSEEKISPFVMQLSTVDEIRKAIPKASRVPILQNALIDVNYTNQNKSVKVHTTDLQNSREIIGKKIEGEYPTTDQAYPDPAREELAFYINLCLLERVIKAAKEFGVPKNILAAKFYIKKGGPKKRAMAPVRIELKNDEGGELQAVIMPMHV